MAALVASCLAEWNAGVVYLPGTADLIARLAGRFRLAIVSNTHKADLVHEHLGALGIAAHFAAVITSVEVGQRKPHPAMYAAALDRLGATPSSSVFVGDSYAADYSGPAGVGITSFLIDPAARHDVPAARRLRSLSELPQRLGLTSA